MPDFTVAEEKAFREYEESNKKVPVSFVREPEFDFVEEQEPEELEVSGHYGAFDLVGHGNVTSAGCGKFFAYWGCLRTDLHKIVTLDGVNYAGKVFRHKVHYSCNNPRCPKCYPSWASREANCMESRLLEAGKRFGEVFHIVVGVPQSDWGLDYNVLRAKAIKVLLARGVCGGSLIFHAFRYHRFAFVHAGIHHSAGYYWSPHWHSLAFILGGYGKCRHCSDYADKGSFACVGCSGFEGRTRRCNVKDGYIVKVLPARETVSGTASYELRHASVKRDVRNFRVVTWFGVASYRKLKFTPEKRVSICPLCRHELVRLLYFGGRDVILDKGAIGYVQDSWEVMNEGSGDCYAEHVGHPFG